MDIYSVSLDVGRLMPAAGIAPFWAPLGLAAFTVVATLMLANFWDMQGLRRDHAQLCFQYNFSIVGGFLIAATTAM